MNATILQELVFLKTVCETLETELFLSTNTVEEASEALRDRDDKMSRAMAYLLTDIRWNHRTLWAYKREHEINPPNFDEALQVISKC